MYPPESLKKREKLWLESLGKPQRTTCLARISHIKTRILSRIPSNFTILQFVLRCLRILGQCHFSYKRNVDGGVYTFAWSSCDSLRSLLAAGIAALGWLVALTHLGLQKFLIFPAGIRYTFTLMEDRLRANKTVSSEKVQANLEMFTFFVSSTALYHLSAIIFGWMNRNKLVKLMNDWKLLRRQLRGMLVSTNAGGAGKGTLTRLAVICIGVACVTLPTVVSLTVFTTSIPSHASRALEVSFYLLIGGYAGLCENLRDLAAILLFQELATNFRQVHDDIRDGFQHGRVSAVRKKTWWKLAVAIRKQARAVSDYLSTPQLGVLLQKTLAVTTCVFLVVTNGYGGTFTRVNQTCVFLVCGILLSLWLKAVAAEGVSSAETAIAHLLTEREFEGSVTMEAQLKDLRDLLLQNPVEINFANVVVLRKRLVLQTIGQILTYLIVLIQFYNQRN